MGAVDGALLEHLRQGDRAALELLYRSHVGDVERYLAARVGRTRRLPATSVADLVQEVFLRAFSSTARPSCDGERDYLPFLVTIGRNVLIDALRRSRREFVDIQDLDAVDAALVGGAADDMLFDLEHLSATKRYVESLSEELRQVHELRFVRSEPQMRAAEALGLSRQRLRTLERKLIDGLRRTLGVARRGRSSGGMSRSGG